MGDHAQPGFFGKIPSTGDFVGRGLPDSFRRSWDLWLTRHIAPRQKMAAHGPDGGLRFRLVSGGRVAAGVIVPSVDSVGRRFPVSLVLVASNLPAPDALDPWCDAAIALDRHQAPDDLWADLDALPVPSGDGPTDVLLLWTKGQEVLAADPVAPAQALDRLWPAGSTLQGGSDPC